MLHHHENNTNPDTEQPRKGSSLKDERETRIFEDIDDDAHSNGQDNSYPLDGPPCSGSELIGVNADFSRPTKLPKKSFLPLHKNDGTDAEKYHQEEDSTTITEPPKTGCDFGEGTSENEHEGNMGSRRQCMFKSGGIVDDP